MHFHEAFETGPLGLLNDLLERFIALEGTTDIIIDISETPSKHVVPPVMDRGLSNSRMQGCRRVFVVGNEAQFELIRTYSVHQELVGMQAPSIVRSLAQALDLLECDRAGFEPWVPRN